MRQYYGNYKGYDIYYEDGAGYTASNPHWEIVDRYGNTIWLWGWESFEDVREYIDKLINPAEPQWDFNIQIKSFNSTTFTDYCGYLITWKDPVYDAIREV